MPLHPRESHTTIGTEHTCNPQNAASVRLLGAETAQQGHTVQNIWTGCRGFTREKRMSEKERNRGLGGTVLDMEPGI